MLEGLTWFVGGSLAVSSWLPALDTCGDVTAGGVHEFAMLHSVRSSIPRLTASAVNTIFRCAPIEARCGGRSPRPRRSYLDSQNEASMWCGRCEVSTMNERTT